MKLAIFGTRGVPNNHGGFEQFAEFLSQYLVNKGHDVYVYNSHHHPFKKSVWRGVKIIHKYDPENRIGSAGQFVYDFNCILDARKRNFDLILQLGYTSSSIFYKLFPKKSIIVTNMDGLEWKRSKYSKKTQNFLKYAEQLAIKHSDHLISDSIGIQSYLQNKYGVESKYIAYGAKIFNGPDEEILKKYKVCKFEYNLLIARLEPENNIVTILDGFFQSKSKSTFFVIGKNDTTFGKYLKNRYSEDCRIIFLGGIYDQNHLDNLRFFSNLYFHGHSVGGTNPSLLEAMSSSALIIAHNNIFNKSILGPDAFYFSHKREVKELVSMHKNDYQNILINNRNKILNKYDWNIINSTYEEYLLKCHIS